jgi:hypothetical protein
LWAGSPVRRGPVGSMKRETATKRDRSRSRKRHSAGRSERTPFRRSSRSGKSAAGRGRPSTGPGSPPCRRGETASAAAESERMPSASRGRCTSPSTGRCPRRRPCSARTNRPGRRFPWGSGAAAPGTACTRKPSSRRKKRWLRSQSPIPIRTPHRPTWAADSQSMRPRGLRHRWRWRQTFGRIA